MTFSGFAGQGLETEAADQLKIKIIMFTLPKLPYSYAALEPAIDAQTMEIHHSQHHQAYVDKLNATGVKGELDDILKNLAQVPENIQAAVRNNGGGHWNHSFFWQIMSKNGGEPSAELKTALEKTFGGLEQFKTAFSDAALGRFGSGWAWLVADQGKLSVMSTPNQDNPLMEGKQAILCLDVWEHAYYILYKWERAKYVENWWGVVNWHQVSDNYSKCV